MKTSAEKQTSLVDRDEMNADSTLDERRSDRTKRIGHYLIQGGFCHEATLMQALSLQKELGHEGIYKPVGDILIESYGLEPEALELSLKRQGSDVLLSVDLFKSLSPQMIVEIAEISEYASLPKDTVIFQQGDPGTSFYLIISGLVRVYQHTDEGTEVTLTELGPSEGIGDMALLTGEPRSASVSSVEATSLLSISKKAFEEIISENPELSMAFARILAERVSRANTHEVKASIKERAYQRFASENFFASEPRLIGKSKIVLKLREKTNELSQTREPVLILGEPGTEKRDVARLIHWNSSQKDNPFLVMDAKTVSLGEPDADSFKGDPLRLELTQNSTLFGHEQGALPFSRNRRLGLLEVAHEGTILIENIDLLIDSVKAKLLEFIQNGVFMPLGGKIPIKSSARIITTSATDPATLVESGKFDPKLYDALCGQIVRVDPLRRRKKDLSLIVDHFIEIFNEQAGKSILGISKEAYKSIMTYNWPGNMAELRTVIRRAVNLADEDLLLPENIFIGLAPISGKLTFNLLKLNRISRIFQNKSFPGVAQLFTAFFFTLILFLGFFGSQAPEQNVSLILTWGLWEPLVILSVIPAARIWCAICPVGALATIMNKYFSLKKNVPAFIRQNGFYLGAIGVGVIIWSEAAYKILYSPKATAILILSIAIPALIFGIIYKRRAWCRYLCPLGGLVGIFSRCSFLELRSNYNICNSDCTTHDCYAGKGDQAGCPMYEGPFSLRSNQNCILCSECIKTCPNESPVLNLRVPGSELVALPKSHYDRTIAFWASIIIGTQLFRGLENYGVFSPLEGGLKYGSIALGACLALITILTWLFVKTAGNLAFTSYENKAKRKTNLMAYVLLPLATAFELGFHLGRMFNLDGQLIPVLGRQLGFDWSLFGLSGAPLLSKTIQILFTTIGFLASRIVLKKLILSFQDLDAIRLSLRQHWSVTFLAMIYISLFFGG